MAKGLADYVHFHANNYMTYGINRVTEGVPSGWEANLTSAIKEKIGNFQKLSNLNPYSEFQDVLKWLMNPPTGAATYTNTSLSHLSYNYLKEAHQIFYEVFTKDFQEDVIPIINEEAANIEGIYIPNLHRIKTSYKTKAGDIRTVKTVSVKKIASNLNAIQNIINSASAEGGYSEAQIKILQELGKQIKTTTQEFGEATNSILGAMGSSKRIPLAQAQPFIDIINRALAYSMGVASEQRGDMWEDFIYAAKLVCQNAALEEIRQSLTDAIAQSKMPGGGLGPIQGNVTSKVTFDSKLFPEELKNKIGGILGTKNYTEQNGVFSSRNATKDKVDLIIQLPATIAGSEKIITVSAKNTAAGSSIKLVDSLSLFKILENMAGDGAADIATHYLNQTSLNIYSGVYNSTAQFVKLSILEQAIRGYKGKNKVDVLIVNMNGNVRVVPVDNILNKVASSIDQIDQMVSLTPNNLQGISFEAINHAIPLPPDPWDRIAKILAAAHNIKITAHLKGIAYN